MLIEGYPYINIDLEPGAYVFDGRSSAGKTYLAYMIEKHKCATKGISVYSYNDALSNKPLESKITNETKILLMDRYDMYCSKIDITAMRRFVSNGGTLIIDCKLLDNMKIEYDFCIICFNTEGIEVYQ